MPIDALLSDAYTARRRALINPDLAWPEMPTAGSPEELGNRLALQRHDMIDRVGQPLPRVLHALRREWKSWNVLARAMVPGEGFEPPTFGLQNRCTTTVLTRQVTS